MGYGLISPGKRFTAINKGTPFGVPQSGSVFTYPSGLIGIYRRAHIIRQRASISAAVSSGYLVLCGSNNIRPLPGPDRRQRHYLGRCKESFMGDGTAGLCSHLPCVADIAHTAGCHAEFNKEYSMKSKRALDISALPPIENLKIGSFGYRCPEPLFKYGPVIHKGYYLCYILEGKGCFQYGSHYYSLSKGQGFLIEPDVIISCQAEKISPWEYAWLELRGPMVRQLLYSMKLSSANPVFHCKQNSHLKYYTQEIMTVQEQRLAASSDIIRLNGLYLLLLSEIIRQTAYAEFSSQEQKYLRQAVTYIEDNFSKNIKVNDISHFVYIDRSYLFSIFKKYLFQSPQQYLTSCRIDKAVELLRTTSLSVEEICHACGYQDVGAFSKLFKKKLGITPAALRKHLISGMPPS